ARVEKLGRVVQGSALEEGQLHDRLVRLSGADAPTMGPYRRPPPFPLFHNVRIGLPDEGAHPCQRITSPVTQFGNLLADQLGGRFASGLRLTRHLPIFRGRWLQGRRRGSCPMGGNASGVKVYCSGMPAARRPATKLGSAISQTRGSA